LLQEPNIVLIKQSNVVDVVHQRHHAIYAKSKRKTGKFLRIDTGHFQDNSRLAQRDVVYALFLELADTVGELAKVARKSRLLNEYQFDELIRRILVAPNGGDEALIILVEVNRLNQEQRQALRLALGDLEDGHLRAGHHGFVALHFCLRNPSAQSGRRMAAQWP